MKKIIISLSLVAVGLTASFGQGTVAIYSTAAGFANDTSATFYSSSLNGVYDAAGTKTVGTANSYYFVLLDQAYNAGLSTINPLDPAWQVGGTATNFTLAGSIRGGGAAAGAPVANWAAPSGAAYNTAGQDSFLLVGWSANLGTSWSQVAAQLQSGSWLSPSGFFGVSGLGNGFSGGGPNSLLAPSIFGSSAGMPGGLPNGITMYATPVPEPGTMALAALGGASLLLFRRRK